MTSLLPSDYLETLDQIKNLVLSAKSNSLRAINYQVVNLYWETGRILSLRTETGWGKGVVEQLAGDITAFYPSIQGFSPSNLWRMKKFYETYKDNQKLVSATREISWTHNHTIFDMVKDEQERLFYIGLAKREGFSVKTLRQKIKNNEYQNYKNFQHNFDQNISDENRLNALTWQFKDDMDLSLLGLTNEPLEREMEDAIVHNIVKFLADLGKDLLFAGRQYQIMIEDEIIRIDILLYHRKLKCFVAIDLKVTDFKFQDVGQIAGYLQALDAQVKAEDENPSIGLIICKDKNRTKVEYALKATNKPVGVMTYSFDELPKEISQFLPSEEQISNSLIAIENIETEM
jgi:predicted nuclease of restriction endonuclease-like (RecB) superfamily